jgi:cytochrome P450
MVKPFSGEGVLLQDGEEHLRVRKLLAPAFVGSAITKYFTIIQDTIEASLSNWGDCTSVTASEKFRQLTLQLICTLTFGGVASQDYKQLETLFASVVQGMSSLFRFDVPFTTFGRAMAARRHLEKFVGTQIRKRRQEGIHHHDILGLLIDSTDEDGNFFNEQEVFTQTLHLLFGGYSTSSITLLYILFEIQQNPEWQEILRTELNQVVPHQRLVLSDLKNLVQMSYFLKEVQRLHPAVYFIPRGVVEDFEFGGYQIPAGWSIILLPLLTHRLPEIWQNPYCFDPLRFAPPREEDKKHPFAFIPFGAGAHRCMGYELAQMEMKVFLATLLRHYDCKLIPEIIPQTTVLQTTKMIEKLKAKIVSKT